MTTISPTDEQAAAIELAKTGQHLAISARAGTGKTSTLQFIAAAKPRDLGRYVAFNKAIADDAARKFPSTVASSTMHSVAMRNAGRPYAHRLGGNRLYNWQIAQQLGVDALNVPLVNGSIRQLSKPKLAGLAVRAVRRFCMTADKAPTWRNVEWIQGIDDGFDSSGKRINDNNVLVSKFIEPYIDAIWRDAQDEGGVLPFDHGYYLKMFELNDPNLECDYVLFDECQDANGVILSIVEKQRSKGSQIILVGDSEQSIYGWNGAVDAFKVVDVDAHTYLSQSFRFGEAIAEVANVVLEELGADVMVRGFDKIDSTIDRLDQPDAFLCRTNSEALSIALDFLDKDVPVAVVGGTSELKAFATAAEKLKEGKNVEHPTLWPFGSWAEVQDFVALDEHGDASELKSLVRLVDKHSPQGVLRILQHLSDERAAKVVVSTAHKSKGREWETVALAGDFPNIGPARPSLSGEEMRLMYVATTRAKLTLDIHRTPFLLDLLPGPEPEPEPVEVPDDRSMAAFEAHVAAGGSRSYDAWLRGK